MAALPTPDPRPDARPQASDERLRLLRELGAQAVPAWAALESKPGASARLVVVERAERKAFDDGEIADWIRDARRLATLDHPNVARVHDVIIRSGEILVVSEFVDGVRWKEFAATTTLETALRVFVDALTGLSALHSLRDAHDPRRQPFKLVHGGLTPDCIVVGLDGIARVVGASRPRSATARLAGTASAYLAPEVLLEDDSVDSRADVYSIGVMLWEALSRRRFLPDLQPSAIVTQLLSGRVPAVTLPEASPWAAALADVVTRALSADPEKRFSSAAAMAAEVRRIGALKLPLAVRVAAGLRAAFGDAVIARREELERGEDRASTSSLRNSRPSTEELSVDVTDDFAEALQPEASQTASTVPPPGIPADLGPKLEELRPVTVTAGPSPPPATAAQAAAPATGAAPLAPVRVAPPPAPVALAPPPLALAPPPPLAPPAAPSPRAPVAVAPPAIAVALAAPPTAAGALPSSPAPSAPARVPITTHTAAPFALATPANLEASRARSTRPSGSLRIAVAAGAVLAIGAATWWVASRNSHPTAVLSEPAAVAQPPLSAPRESASESPAPQATGAPALEADPASTNAIPRANPPAPTNATAPEPEPASATALTARAPAPAGAAPVRPKHAPIRHGYDPQGI